MAFVLIQILLLLLCNAMVGNSIPKAKEVESKYSHLQPCLYYWPGNCGNDVRYNLEDARN